MISPRLLADDRPLFQSTLDTAFSFIDEDGFVVVIVEQQVRFKGLAAAVQGPIRLRVVDRSPEDDGVLRRQDWDEPSDFARLVPFIAFQRTFQDGFVDLYAGALNGISVGHGALVSYYFNSLQMDHYQGGTLLRGEWWGSGLELAMDDIVSPNLLVGRPYLAPLAWFIKGDWPRRLKIGFTLGADLRAPQGGLDNGRTAIVATGFDLSWQAVFKRWLSLKPYLDFMFMDGAMGLHAGMDTLWTLSSRRELFLHFQGEYRYVGSDAHPALINPFYDYKRLSYDVQNTGDDVTLADHLGDDDDLPKSHGFMFEMSFEWRHKLRLGARYDTEGVGRAHWVMFRLGISPKDGYDFNLFYAGQDISGGPALFSTAALFGLALRARIWGPLDFFSHFTRCWRTREDNMRYANEIAGGVGVSFSF
jgi:hypothetical protein